jgi:hypothetical protein
MMPRTQNSRPRISEGFSRRERREQITTERHVSLEYVSYLVAMIDALEFNFSECLNEEADEIFFGQYVTLWTYLIP